MVPSYDIICVEITYNAGGQNNESQVTSVQSRVFAVLVSITVMGIIPESQTANPGSKVRYDEIVWWWATGSRQLRYMITQRICQWLRIKGLTAAALGKVLYVWSGWSGYFIKFTFQKTHPGSRKQAKSEKTDAGSRRAYFKNFIKKQDNWVLNAAGVGRERSRQIFKKTLWLDPAVFKK